MPVRLSVNLNKIALLRNQRDAGIPDLLEFANLALTAGADGITVHPRPDERHIRPTDVMQLVEFLSTANFPYAELNVEGYPSDPFLALVEEVKPTQVTLVPDAPSQRTSDQGWDLARNSARLAGVIERLVRIGCRVSLFIEPNGDHVEHAKKLSAQCVELYTGPFAAGMSDCSAQYSIADYRDAANVAVGLGLTVNAGHDLNLDNLGALISAIPELAEVSIGHALTADALRMGFSNAVQAYLSICRRVASG